MIVVVAAGWLAACEAPDGAGGGAAGSGGAVSAPTCGGDLIGEWGGSNPHFRPRVPPPPEDPCYKLAVYPQADGTFGAASRWPAPERRDALLKFDAAHFSWAITDRGPVTIAYAASCLAKTTPRPTCAQLAPALLISGLGEGSVRQVDCADAGGGCTCTFSISETGGPYGEWSAAGGLLTLVSNPGTAYEKTVETTYCNDGSTLRFGAAIDAVSAGLSRFTFELANCADGRQGALEDGVDCGFYCPTACP